ncbi:MAG: hypothetical protein HZB13_02540 [Acidobacteria bacterium]|nr:hypothetical protein [Acidobacteriota bacterium]
MTPAYLLGQIDGENISSLSADAILVTADVLYELNAHATCKLVYRQSPDNRFPIEEWIGKGLRVIAVDAGGAELILFSGVASSVDLHYEISGSYNLVIEGVSQSMRMDLRPRLRSHPRKNLRGHLQDLLEATSLNLNTAYSEEGPRSFEMGLLQIGETDFEFFRRLVDRFGLAFRVTVDGIKVLDHYVDAGCSVNWRTESGLLDFRMSGRLGAADFSGVVYNRNEAMSYDRDVLSIPGKFGTAASLIDSALAGSSDNHWSGYVDTPFISRSEQGLADEIELESQRSTLTRTYGTGQSREASIRPGQKVTINALHHAARVEQTARHQVARADGGSRRRSRR